MTFDKFTIKSQEAIQKAQSIANENSHQQISSEHLLLAFTDQAEGTVVSIIKKIGGNVELIKQRATEFLEKIPRVSGGSIGQLYISQEMNRVFEQAIKEANQLRDDYVSTEHLLIGLVEKGERV